MKKIRDDLEGVVFVRDGADVVKLSAGDDVPDGVEVGDHLIAKEATAARPVRRSRGVDEEPPG